MARRQNRYRVALGDELRIVTDVDTHDLMEKLSAVARKQVPFATALALTRLGAMGRDEVREEMPRVFDAPTRWTMNSLYLDKARTDRMYARVWFRDFAPKGTPAEKYLQPEVHGGERNQKRFERALAYTGRMRQNQWAIPGRDAPLDAYGNIRGSFITGMLNKLRANPLDPTQHESGRLKARRRGGTRGTFFVMRRAGVPIGVYRRIGKKRLEHILSFTTDRPDYRARLPFFQIMQNVVARNYDKQFGKALAYAIATRKK